jgi:hypothetical protein
VCTPIWAAILTWSGRVVSACRVEGRDGSLLRSGIELDTASKHRSPTLSPSDAVTRADSDGGVLLPLSSGRQAAPGRVVLHARLRGQLSGTAQQTQTRRRQTQRDIGVATEQCGMGSETCTHVKAAGVKRWLADVLRMVLVVVSLCLDAHGPVGASSGSRRSLARPLALSPLRCWLEGPFL